MRGFGQALAKGRVLFSVTTSTSPSLQAYAELHALSPLHIGQHTGADPGILKGGSSGNFLQKMGGGGIHSVTRNKGGGGGGGPDRLGTPPPPPPLDLPESYNEIHVLEHT